MPAERTHASGILDTSARDRGVSRGAALALLGGVNSRPTRPGDTHAFSRRVVGGENRLRPDRQVNGIIGYLLAVLSQRHQIDLSAICFLGNHEHGVGVDREGKIPAFWRDFHATVAKHLNATFGDSEPLWDSRQTNSVRPVQPDDTLAKIAYAMANPVRHRLVKWARSYPGLRRAWPAPPKTFKRPVGFLDKEAKRPDGSLRWPEQATLVMHRPAGFDHLSDAELAVRIAERCSAEEERWRAEAEADEAKFMTRRAILKESRRWRPKKKPTSEITPRVACKDPVALNEALRELKAWHAEYRSSFKRLQMGEKDVEFPFGTYKLRLDCAVRVRAAPV